MILLTESYAINIYYMASDVTINLGTRGQALDGAPFKQAKYIQADVMRHSYNEPSWWYWTYAFKRNVLWTFLGSGINPPFNPWVAPLILSKFQNVLVCV